MHEKMNLGIVDAGGEPLRVFYCPHHPQAGCNCRKPKPDLLKCAVQSFNATPEKTLYIGDSEKDLIAAENAGCSGALVLTGNGQITAQSDTAKRISRVYADLATAADALVNTTN